MVAAYGFSRSRRGHVRLTLGPDDAAVLTQLLEQLDGLLAPEGADSHEQLDPLAALVGIGTSTTAPEDPALARLLPDAYPDDADRSAEFRRYTELTLREKKRQHARVARRTLEEADRSSLSGDEVQAWLLTLNDLRLTLGSRLEVTEDLEAELAQLAELPPDDPRVVMFQVYDWLGYLQVTLLRVLDP